MVFPIVSTNGGAVPVRSEIVVRSCHWLAGGEKRLGSFARIIDEEYWPSINGAPEYLNSAEVTSGEYPKATAFHVEACAVPEIRLAAIRLDATSVVQNFMNLSLC